MFLVKSNHSASIFLFRQSFFNIIFSSVLASWINLITNLPSLHDEPLYFPWWLRHRNKITAQRRSLMACKISLGLCLCPSGTCQSVYNPVKPKQSACIRGHSLKGVAQQDNRQMLIESAAITPGLLDRQSICRRCAESTNRKSAL